MKSLKLLNKKYLSIILIFSLSISSSYSEEPIDIWSIEKKETIEKNDVVKSLDKKNISQNSIYQMQSGKETKLDIEQDQTLISKEVEIVGIYDPAKNGLDINMWSKSDGIQLLNLFKNINKIDLSKDASEILNILLLTNSYYPSNNISKEQFIEVKSKWLIKNSDFKLIEDYLLKNQIVNENPELTKYLVDEYLSRSEIEKSCEIFSKIKDVIEDEYLSKFNIYCLINDNKKDDAQLLLDLKKELGFQDKFYEKKIDYLMGYENEADRNISEKTILDFHLSRLTNPDFEFEPKDSTSKQIWKYLSASNLLYDVKAIELTDLNKIATIEKATHEKNYEEKELFDLYKRFQFNINQLLNIKESSKTLPSIEARALIYQGILIISETKKRIELLNALKNSFINDDIENAFDQELRVFLKEINIEEVPSKYKNFYNKHVKQNEVVLKNIKINNKILHQSRLLDYFKKDSSIKNISKELNESLKKIKRDKKYFFSLKDIILVEALKSDGVKVSEKYKNLYDSQNPQIPADIEIYINNGDMGSAMLRLVQVIGQDELKDLDPETLYFIISTLNMLNIDPLRNEILLKVLSLKV